MSPTSFQLLHPASCSNIITVYENFVNSIEAFFKFSIVAPSIIFAARTRGLLRAPSRRLFFQHFRIFAPLKFVPLRELIFRKHAWAIFIFFLQIFNSVCHYFFNPFLNALGFFCGRRARCIFFGSGFFCSRCFFHDRFFSGSFLRRRFCFCLRRFFFGSGFRFFRRKF